jgi:predicted RNase H-like HicB family nuclease
MKDKIKINIIITEEDGYYIAKCVENGVCSQGKTIEEAILNVKEAVELYIEDFPLHKPHPSFLYPLEVIQCAVKNT